MQSFVTSSRVERASLGKAVKLERTHETRWTTLPLEFVSDTYYLSFKQDMAAGMMVHVITPHAPLSVTIACLEPRVTRHRFLSQQRVNV